MLIAVEELDDIFLGTEGSDMGLLSLAPPGNLSAGIIQVEHTGLHDPE